MPWTPEQREAHRVTPAKAREHTQAWRHRHPDRWAAYQRRSILKRYGITPADYDTMLSQQAGACAICRSGNPGRNREYFCVDHDHATGKVRGLLCVTCNSAIGLLGESSTALIGALHYLGYHHAVV